MIGANEWLVVAGVSVFVDFFALGRRLHSPTDGHSPDKKNSNPKFRILQVVEFTH